MVQILIGAAVALIGTVFGWTLNEVTDRARRRREGRTAARMIFFELGLLLSASSYAHEGDFADIPNILSRSAWDQHAAAFAKIGDDKVLTLLATIYSTDLTRMTIYSKPDYRAPDEWRDEMGLAVQNIVDAVWLVGEAAGMSESEIESILAPFEGIPERSSRLAPVRVDQGSPSNAHAPGEERRRLA